jgi:hypothetical protein
VNLLSDILRNELRPLGVDVITVNEEEKDLVYST